MLDVRYTEEAISFTCSEGVAVFCGVIAKNF